MSFVAQSTTADGCPCSEMQILQAINQNISSLGNALVNDSKRVSVASFTRPADTPTYDALDVIGTAAGAAMEFANIGPVGGGIVFLNSLGLRIDAAALPTGMAGFRLHLFNQNPSAIADAAAFNIPVADRLLYLGFIELPTPLDMGATLWTETEGMFYPVRKEVQLVSSSVWGRLQTLAGFIATASVVKILTLASVE